MSQQRTLTVVAYLTRDRKKIDRPSLSLEEQRQFANFLNQTAMNAAGYFEDDGENYNESCIVH